MAQSYIIRQSIVRTCRGYCKGYHNAKLPVKTRIRDYSLHGRRFCPTCEYVFLEEDCNTFPYPRYCVCCKKPLRRRVYGSRKKDEWRKRY